MKKTKFFFLTLLAGLLMSVDAMGYNHPTPLSYTDFVNLAGTGKRFGIQAVSDNTATYDLWFGFTNASGMSRVKTLTKNQLFTLTGTAAAAQIQRCSDSKYFSGANAFGSTAMDVKLENRAGGDYSSEYTKDMQVSIDNASGAHYNANSYGFASGTGGWSAYVTFGPYYIETVHFEDEDGATIAADQDIIVLEGATCAPAVPTGYTLVTDPTSGAGMTADGEYTFVYELTNAATYTVTCVDQDGQPVTGGGVVYNGIQRTGSFKGPQGLTEANFTAIAVSGYLSSLSLSGTAITVTYYSLANSVWRFRSNGRGDGRWMYATDSSLGIKGSQEESDRKGMWYVEAVEGGYTLRNLETAKYLQYNTATSGQWTTVATAGDKTTLTITSAATAGLYLLNFPSSLNSGYHSAHDPNWDGIVTWGESGTASQWTVELVPESVHGIADIPAYFNFSNEKAALAAKFPAASDAMITLVPEVALTESMLSTNAQEGAEGPIKNLVDGDNSTYFHTRYQGTNPNANHYIQVDLGEGKAISDFIFWFVPRNNNNIPTNMIIAGSNDGSNFTDIQTIDFGFPSNGSGEYKSPVIGSSTAYRYFRFTVTATNTGGKFGNYVFFTMGEFKMYNCDEIQPLFAPTMTTAWNNLKSSMKSGLNTYYTAEKTSEGITALQNAASDLETKTAAAQVERATITYVVKEGETTLWSKDVEAIVGASYPTVENPNYFVTLGGFPEGTVTGDETKQLTYTTRYVVAADPASVTQWYALDIHGNQGHKGAPLYYNADDNTYVRCEFIDNNTPLDDFKHGAVKSDNFAWAFVGNPFTGIKLYNRGNKKYANQANDADEKITFDATGTVFQICKTSSTVENSFAVKVDGRKYYFNHRGEYIQGWTAADEGSSLRAYEITPATAADAVEYTFNAEYGTLIVPFYAEIPEDVEVYTCSALSGNVLTLTAETSMIKPGVPYIIKSEEWSEFEFLGGSKLTTPTTATVGLLTGVYASTALNDIISSVGENKLAYVLAKPADRVVFQYLEGDYETATIGANRCFITLDKPETPAEVKGTLYFDEETGIESIHNSEFKIHNDGKFLENGRIVIVKNNSKYNVAGQMIK